jgi:radical SAM protein with 4Fe4S-binding SPASM domain
VDGTVVPCCLDAEADIPLGNIHAQSLAGILSSPRAVAMRTGFSQRRLTESLCRRCTFRQSF